MKLIYLGIIISLLSGCAGSSMFKQHDKEGSANVFFVEEALSAQHFRSKRKQVITVCQKGVTGEVALDKISRLAPNTPTLIYSTFNAGYSFGFDKQTSYFCKGAVLTSFKKDQTYYLAHRSLYGQEQRSCVMTLDSQFEKNSEMRIRQNGIIGDCGSIVAGTFSKGSLVAAEELIKEATIQRKTRQRLEQLLKKAKDTNK